MADLAQAFHEALMLIGLTDLAAREIQDQGLDSILSLLMLTENDVKQMVKVLRDNGIIVPYMAQQRLQVMRYWTKHLTHLGLPVDADMFTLAVVEVFGQKMLAEQADKDVDINVKPPDKFMIGSKWSVFKEGFETYLNSQKGRGTIPLSYVIRVSDVVNPIEMYETEHEQLTKTVPLSGPDFIIDNGNVYDILKGLILAGPAWPWMQEHDKKRDGRKAWKSLIAHYEGDSVINRNKEAAYASITCAEYLGDRRNFTFETFVTLHQQAHLDLERYGEAVPESKKVRDLLAGIKDGNALAAKLAVQANPLFLNDFTQATNFLATTLDTGTKRSIRNLSQVETRGEIRGGYQGRGRGRGRGRGHGRGRFQGRGQASRIVSDQYYSPNEWAKLSLAQKNEIFQKRGTKREREVTSVTASPNQATAASSITSRTTTAEGTESVGDQMSRRSSRNITPVCTSNRSVNDDIRVVAKMKTMGHSHKLGRAELDSHADTCCAGATSAVIEYTGKTCDVSPFSKEYDAMKNVPIVKAATAYDDAETGETFILIMGQALYFGDRMENSLLCPNQMRANGVIVDDVPIHLSSDGQSTHSIYIPEESIRLPLQLHGCLSYLPTRLPTQEEIENKMWLVLTNEIEWDPYASMFEENEEVAKSHNPSPQQRRNIYGLQDSDCVISSVLSSISGSLIPKMFSKIPVATIGATMTSAHQSVVTKESLAKRWGIGTQIAAQTLQVTTQKGIRNAVHPIHRRFRTKQVQLKYDQLGTQHGRFYSDTMFSSVKSTQGNTMGQIFVNDIGFTRFMPMKMKSEAGYALSEFIQDVGIPASLHTDDAKELTLGTWRKTRLDHAIKQTLTEPHSPWQNRAEGAIRELKRHVQCLMNHSKTPKHLWDYCSCYAAEI